MHHSVVKSADLRQYERAMAGRGMLTRFGPLLKGFARTFLANIPYPESARARIAELSKEGIIVYVHRARNPVDYLALSHATAQLGLPRARFIGGLRVYPWQPWARLLGGSQGLKGAPKDLDRREEWLLQRCVEAGFAAQLFLRRPLTLMTTKSGYRARYVEALIHLQRTLDRPIYLVPHFLALRAQTANLEPTAADAVFGTIEEPGALRAFTRLMVSRGRARWEVSEPINLQAFIKEQSNPRDAVLAKKVRWSVLHHLARVERVCHGPLIKPVARLRDEALSDPSFVRDLPKLAESLDTTPEALRKKSTKIYNEIAAKFDVDIARTLDAMLRLVWNRIYDGLEWDDEGVERLRHAARDGSLVIVPSHRSHVDYLVISQVLFWNSLMPPLIAAGANLSFFPLGPIFRRGGAYFIRRTIKGDPLYARVLRAYVKQLLQEGWTQEFFIEGGRSRTGKTLPPKMGILSMLIDAWLEDRSDDVLFVPSSISYEKLIEAASYTRELGGAEKEKESAGALIRTAGVLRSKYGRVYVTFDEPVSLAKTMEELGHSRSSELNAEEKRALVQSMAFRIAYGINRAGVVTANALVVTALFGYRRRAVQLGLLRESVRLLAQHIETVAGDEARFSSGLREDLANKVSAAIDRLVADGLVHRESAAEKTFYRIDDKAFLELDYYKNNLIHHFVPDAILVTALYSFGVGANRGSVAKGPLAERARLLSRVFKLEFIFRVDKTFDDLFQATLERMINIGFLSSNETEEISVPDTEHARNGFSFSVNLVANFVDAYASVMRNMEESCARTENKKALVLRLLENCKADFLSGEIRCPEAVSKVLVENAIALAMNLGALGLGSGRPLWEPSPELMEIVEVLEQARRRRQD